MSSASAQQVVTPKPVPSQQVTVVSVAPAERQPNPLIAGYLAQLALHPLRTKSITLGILQFVQEVLASHLAGVPSATVPSNAPLYQHLLAAAKIDSRAVKMTIYGAFISAPLGHTLVGLLQKAFAGRTGKGVKFAQIVASNLVVAPIQIAVYLASMAVINGAKSTSEVIRTVKAGFFSVMRIIWMTSPLSLMIAQNYLAPEMWVPFFNLIQFVTGTYFNTRLKRMRLAAAKKQEKKDE